MAGTARLMLIVLLGGTLAASGAYAQTTRGTPALPDGPAADSPTEPVPEFLKTFPRPPDQPTSLLAPAPPMGPPPPDLETPYFQQDPLLDPPALGGIGWFGDVDVGFLKPHLVSQLSNTLTFPDGSTTTVGVDPSHLNWTVSPRFELGYRLPSGFGGISLAYRFLTAQGSEGVIGADGTATLSSRLNINTADLNWSSREYTPWGRLWDMRIRIGVRYTSIYFDSQANEPFDEAAAGTTIFSQRTTNSFVGIGTDAALEMGRRLGFWGLRATGLLEFADSLGRVRQGYFASSTTSASGASQAAYDFEASSMNVPVLMTQLGLSWQPPAYPTLRMYAGWQFEYWWNAGRLLPLNTFGFFFINGITLRGEWNF